jgi:hypothetical protein
MSAGAGGGPRDPAADLQWSHLMWLLFNRAFEGIARLVRRHRKPRPHRPPAIR